MSEKQFETFHKIITYDSNKSFDELLTEEVEAQPNNKDFLEGVRAASFSQPSQERLYGWSSLGSAAQRY